MPPHQFASWFEAEAHMRRTTISFLPCEPGNSSYALLSSRLVRELDGLGISFRGLADGDTADLAILPPDSAYASSLKLSAKTVLFTMYETTRLRAEWVPVLNKVARIIVPSEWCAQSFVASGVTAPLSICPLGVDLNVFVPRVRPMDRPFRFSTVISNSVPVERKNLSTLLWAFSRLEPGSAQLLIRGRNPGITNPDILFTEAHISETEYARWIAATDCGVFPSHGEGFGLCPLEYSACGVPVLCPKHGGLLDHVPFHILGWVRSSEIPAMTSDGAYATGNWCSINRESLLTKMQEMLSRRSELRALGLACRDAVQQLTWSAAANRVRDVVLKSSTLK